MNKIAFILHLKCKSDMTSVEKFIKELSVPHTASCDEPNTRSFEWYFNEDYEEATLLESFVDSDAAILRVNNLQKGPVNESFQRLFEVSKFEVLGNASQSLKETLDAWQPHFLRYIDGFNKNIT
mgnify:FL=1